MTDEEWVAAVAAAEAELAAAADELEQIRPDD